MKNKKKIIPLPFPVYFGTVAILAFGGLSASTYLSINHYRNYTDIGYKSFCAISRAINCDTVSQSAYSILFGVPVAIWGVIGYMFFLLFLPFAWGKIAEKKRMWPLLFLVSVVFSCISIIYAFISTYYIQSYCIVCMFSYGSNFFLLYYVWLIRRRFERTGVLDGLKRDIGFLWNIRKKCVFLFSPFLIGVILVVISFPDYWNFAPPPLSAGIPKGITEDGHPWIGAENPELVITEFTDYQCFQCKKMHFYLRRIVARHPGKIRLVHRYFPMDHKFNPIVKDPFHVGSGAMALLAEYAQTQGKFWEMNDILFNVDRQKGTINIKELAEEVGLDYRALSYSTKNRIIRYKVKHDIAIGMKLGINGTPAYVIDGEVYLGRIPPEIIRNVPEGKVKINCQGYTP